MAKTLAGWSLCLALGVALWVGHAVAQTPSGDTLRGQGAYLRGLGWYNLATAKANSINTDTTIRWKQDLRQIQQEIRDIDARKQAGQKAKTDEVKRRQAEREKQLRVAPTATDVQTGEALNVLVFDLTDPEITLADWQAKPVPLPEGTSVKELIFKFIPFSRSTKNSTALSKGVIALSRLDIEGKWPTVVKLDTLERERLAYEKAYRKVHDQILDGEFNLNSVLEMDRSLESLRAKANVAVPMERGFRTEAVKFVDDLKDSTRFFDAETVDYAREILIDTKDHDATTVAELIAFMLKYRLQFANAERSPSAREHYGKVFEALRQQMQEFQGTSSSSPGRSLGSTPSWSPSASGDWIDLLEWAEGFDWAPRGTDWNANVEGIPTKSGITMKRKKEARFPLPAIIDGDYELEVELTVGDGRYPIFFLEFPVGTRHLSLQVGDNRSGLHGIDGIHAWSRNETQRSPALIVNNKRHRVRIRTRHDGDNAEVKVDFDDVKDYLSWSGGYTRLNGSSLIGHLNLCGYEHCAVTFHSAKVRMNSGTIRRDTITDADREQDRRDGFVRLVGEQANAIQVGAGRFVVNQALPEFSSGGTQGMWPLITRDFKVCDDFYGAHAPSRLKCPIPPGAKSFSVVGYNDSSRTVKYQIYVDGNPVYDSGVTDIAIAKVDLPTKASLLELVTDPAGNASFDHTNWCYPRFHSVSTDKITDKMLDGKPGPLKFIVASHSVGAQKLTHNVPINTLKAAPVHFRDALPCDEFLCAHASSTVTYQVPEDMRRFTAIGYNVISHHVKYEVWADAKRIYESPQAGIIPIDVKLPPGTKTIELKINDLGDRAHYDQSFWCYPRLHRK